MYLKYVQVYFILPSFYYNIQIPCGFQSLRSLCSSVELMAFRKTQTFNYFTNYGIIVVDIQLQGGDDLKDFGEVLKGIRNERGVTQRELAKLIGVDFTYISKIEHDAQILSEEKLLAIEVALGVKKYSFVLLSGRVPTDFKTIILLDEDVQDYLHERLEIWNKLKESEGK